jgi:transcriptional regulator GlxA family with amidase domain
VSGWKRLDPDRSLRRATDPRIRAVLERLQTEEVVTQPMHIEKLAMAVRISSSRLRHLFRGQVGMPLARYVKLLQMQRARELLEHSFLEIKEVCAHVGLNDVSHFSRDYKKVYQEAPSRTRAASCKAHPAIERRKVA